MNIQQTSSTTSSYSCVNQQSPNYHYKRITSSHQKIPIAPLLNQHSPRELKYPLETNPFFNTQYSPQPPQKHIQTT